MGTLTRALAAERARSAELERQLKQVQEELSKYVNAERQAGSTQLARESSGVEVRRYPHAA